jgi:hypothetical protein
MDSRIWQICSFKFVLKIVNNADQMMCNAYGLRQFGYLVMGQSLLTQDDHLLTVAIDIMKKMIRMSIHELLVQGLWIVHKCALSGVLYLGTEICCSPGKKSFGTMGQ